MKNKANQVQSATIRNRFLNVEEREFPKMKKNLGKGDMIYFWRLKLSNRKTKY